MSSNTNTDILQVQGRMAMGYGIIPKMAMQDRRLTIEAKAIYSYFCSYAGAGNSAFPGRDKILYDLQISENRYYKHFNILKDYGYIKVTQNVDNKGKFKNNIYTLIEEIRPYLQNRDTDKKPYLQNPCTDIPCTENEGTIINSLNNNSSYNYQSQSQGHTEPKTDNDFDNDLEIVTASEKNAKKKEHNPITHQSEQDSPFSINLLYDYNTYKEIIQDNIDFDSLLVAHPAQKETIEELVNCMLDVICTKGEYVKINGEEKSRQLVISQYLKINYSDIEHVIGQFENQRHKITHLHSYLKTMLYTVKQENSLYYTNAVRADGVV